MAHAEAVFAQPLQLYVSLVMLDYNALHLLSQLGLKF